MGRMLDVCSPRPQRDGKTYWMKVGRAWFADDGNMTLYLDAMPAPTMNKNMDGVMQYQLHLFEQTPKDTAPARGGASPNTRESAADAKARASSKVEKGSSKKKAQEELDDEIPF